MDLDLNKNKRPLRYMALWLALGWLFVLLVIYLSLTPSPPPSPGVPQGDKLGHFLVYAGLTGWFLQIYAAREAHLWIAGGFIALGILLEVLQGLGGVRYFEWWDMVANTSGVLVALALADTRFGTLLLRLEQRWLVPAAR
ncbi:VanZ family protein [Ectothiorhodospiraceae bacterium 2226]|nr:VanZ family protein [Ectothiorhodospiraceae bacterium 2226]